MKKHSVLWLLPLAAALFFGCKSTPDAQSSPPAATGSTTPSASVDASTLSPPITGIASDGDSAPVVSAAPIGETAPVLVLNDPISQSVTVSETLHSIPRSTPISRRDVTEEWSSDLSVPSWVLAPDGADGVIVGIGSARGSTTQLSIQMAEARARQDIAFQLSTQVDAIITDYANNVGNQGDETQKGEFNLLQASKTEMIGRQMANITLAGVKVTKRARTSDNTWWVEVTWTGAQARQAVADAAMAVAEEAARRAAEEQLADLGTNSSVTPVPAAAAADIERAAQEAVRQMDEYLAKAGLKSSVVSEE